MDLCVRVKRVCNNNEGCEKANNELVTSQMERHHERDSALRGPYCGARVLQSMSDGPSAAEKPPLSADLTEWLESVYVFDFAHYAGPSNKPWAVCSTEELLTGGMTHACSGVASDLAEYCSIWRPTVVSICTQKMESHGATDPNAIQCEAGEANEAYKNHKVGIWEWRKHLVEDEAP
jgi:hypothetical protein